VTEKRFDIVVQDKVARTIKTELDAIGASAKGTRGFVSDLKKEMSTLASAQGGMGSAASTNNRNMREQAASTYAASRAQVRYRQDIEASTRALREQAQAARDLASARAAAAGAGVPTQGGQQYGPPAPGPRTQPRPAPAPGPSAGPASAGPASAGGTAATAANIAAAARSSRELSANGGLAANAFANLAYNVNDVVVSLGSGQKLMTVALQQGAQIAQIPMQAGISWKQFGSQAAVSFGLVKRTGDAALDAAAAQATMAASALAQAEAAAAGNVRVAETEAALAAAQQRTATTSTEQTAAAARLTAANEALAASNAEAAVATEALEAAQGTAARAQTAAAGAATRGLSAFARAGLVGVTVATAAAGAIALLTKEANDDSGLKKYTTAMGYTKAEVKKLNAVTVEWGDTTKAVMQVVGGDVAAYAKGIGGSLRDQIKKEVVATAAQFGLSMDDIKQFMGDAMDWVSTKAKQGMASLYALGAGTKAYLGELEKGGIGGLFKTMTGNGDPNLLANTYGKAYKEGLAGVEAGAKYLGSLDDRITDRARKNASARQASMAKDYFDPKKGPKAPKGWDRAQELKNANAELDAQVKLTSKYGDELERANQLEQIAKKFRDHNVPLTAAETAGLEAKIRALQEGRRVQEAMTAADEAANGSSRKYEASVTALNNLLDSGAISQEQYREQMRLTERAYEDATNPLAALNRELMRNGELMGLYGRDRDVKSYIQQLEQAAEAQGKSIYEQDAPPTTTNGNEVVVTAGRRRMTTEAQGMVDEYKRQQQQEEYTRFFEQNDSRQRAQDPSDPSYALEKHKELYAELKRLRETDVIDEGEAAQRKADLDRAYLDARLANASTVLGNLSALQSSKNREVAALGKAAAMTQATIDGIAAVQAALRGPPGPPWSYAIAASTGVMAAANVAKIAGIGFKQGGYTGSGNPNDVAGPVHRNEFVFDAAATSRIGVPALEAIRRGEGVASPANDNGGRGIGGPRVTISPMPGVFVEEVATSDDHIMLLARRAARDEAPKAVARDLRSGANSHMGTAMKTTYGTPRIDR